MPVTQLLSERHHVTDILTILLMHNCLAFACAKCMHVRKQYRMSPQHKSSIMFAGVLAIALKEPMHLSVFHLLSADSSAEGRIKLIYGISCLHTWKAQAFSVSGHAFCTYFQ